MALSPAMTARVCQHTASCSYDDTASLEQSNMGTRIEAICVQSSLEASTFTFLVFTNADQSTVRIV
eukprot:2543236-Amphidinium_carterae.1